ncbi:MAG: ArsA family ATPase [Deltaproteobacteria bacterium]|nr:ArsA family ATPase [Deltaproteobacteria bacterium]
MTSPLVKLVEEKKILICCGSGGVGKTTTAAAIALEAARRGKKTIVLTIDPARRLASAMGLDTLSDEPQKIPLQGGFLDAMMLDTKRTFDALIEKYSPSRSVREAILANRLYQHLSSMLAGSQEYMAMEKLYEIAQKDYDLIVLDTPPTRHALDFLEGPEKMVNIVNNSLLKWFLKPSLFMAGGGFKLLRRGGEKILSVFDKLAGFSFLHELSEMLVSIAGLLGGFQNRASAVYDLLRDKSVGFLLVTSPETIPIQDALYFFKEIRRFKLPFCGFIVNRVHTSFLGVHGSVPEKEIPDRLREPLLQNLEEMELLAERDHENLSLLEEVPGKNNFCLQVPQFTADIHDLKGLGAMAGYLFSEESAR